jgi:hypothetical protein
MHYLIADILFIEALIQSSIFTARIAKRFIPRGRVVKNWNPSPPPPQTDGLKKESRLGGKESHSPPPPWVWGPRVGGERGGGKILASFFHEYFKFTINCIFRNVFNLSADNTINGHPLEDPARHH